MSLTQEFVQTTEAPTWAPYEPSTGQHGVGLGWIVLLLAVAATALALVLAPGLGSDDALDVGSPNAGLIENGSITAIDHGNEPAPSAHAQVVENGSVVAVEHASAQTGRVAPAANHAQVVENGSVVAVEHASEADGS